MANGTESAEIVVSSIRAGMKREFAMMMKAQAECGIAMGQRRVTRSQNNGDLRRSLAIDKRAKSSDAKKRKKEFKTPSVGEELKQSMNAERLGKCEVMKNGDGKVGLMVEEEEPKSDVVDGNSDDERKGNILVESGITEGDAANGGETKDSEEEEVKSVKPSETMVDLVKAANVYDRLIQTDIGETVDEEPKDCVMEPMPDKLPISGDEVKAADTDGLNAERTGENGFSDKPLRRFTRSILKMEAAEIPQVTQIEDMKGEEVVEPIMTPLKLEMKMSKKVALKRFPTKLKELLETGLLEGLPVRYIRAAKMKGLPEAGLRGVVKGSGILCFCKSCDGNTVVKPNQFELHAGSSNKRPPEYIYMENGNTLRDVLNACKDSRLDSVEAAIRNAIGRADIKGSSFCLNCRGSMPETASGGASFLCNSCVISKEPQCSPAQLNATSNRSPLPVPVTKSSDQTPSNSCPRSKAHGKLTRKDLRMHKLVFEGDVLPDGTELAYFVRGEKLLGGYKKGYGIFCYCCKCEVSPSQFEAHAGCASRRKPYLNIYTSNGVSLHELSIKLSMERKSSGDENDDLCSICADGGDLLCCDNCPRAFHPECVSLPNIPRGSWYCRYCQNMFQKEKFVERNINAIAAGRVAGIDALEQITKRCIRIVETVDADIGGCALCRSHDFSKSIFGPRTVIICDQCEKEYHVGCLKEHNMDDLKELPNEKWFCCTDCNRIHLALQKLVLDGEQKLPETLLDIIRKKNEGTGAQSSSDLDVKWRLLSGKMASEETRGWFSSAVSIFHEQFDPIADSNTGRLDLIPQMVYGRNFKEQDFSGMYCALLIVNSSVVSAGLFRIFGKEVAELPLVATSTACQGQGYFQSLFTCIEDLLRSLDVGTLVLPSADEAKSIWTNRFGFDMITDEQLKHYRKHYQMMIFQGTSMLHKPVSSPEVFTKAIA